MPNYILNLKKALLLNTCLLIPTSYASTTLDFYGTANLSLQISDEGQGNFTEVQSNVSRFGFKGSEQLENNLTLVFQAEFTVDLDGDSTDECLDGELNQSSKCDNIQPRDQFIGLKSPYGTLLLGRNNPVLRKSQGNIDLFGYLEGDIRKLWKGEGRLANTVMYTSPRYRAISLGVTYAAAEKDNQPSNINNNGDSALSAALFYGDKNFSQLNTYAALAIDNKVKGYNTTRLSVQHKNGVWLVGAMLQQQKQLSNKAKMSGALISGQYRLSKVAYKTQLQTASFKRGDNRLGVSAGIDYYLSEKSKIYGFYTAFNMDSLANERFLAVGVEYKL